MPLHLQLPLTLRSPSFLGVAFVFAHDLRVTAARVLPGVALDLEVIIACVCFRPSSARHGCYMHGAVLVLGVALCWKFWRANRCVPVGKMND